MISEEILTRWPSPEEFYNERDDRTVRLIGDLHAYVARPVEICVDPEMADEATVQRITLVAANLTARWARNVRVVVPSDVALANELRGSATTLRGRLMQEMAGADPFGKFAVINEPGTDGNSLRLFVGAWRNGEDSIGPDDYIIHAASWTALGRRGESSSGLSTGATIPSTVAAAALAGALGAADLFKRAIGHAPSRWMPAFAWDTWSSRLSVGAATWAYDDRHLIPSELELGSTLLAGAGAIGSAFVYVADMMPVNGTLTVIDRDNIEITNLNRSPMFGVTHALTEPRKTMAVAEYLSRQEVKVIPVDGSWRDHAAALGNQPFDVWISLTNEDGAWAEMPFQLPPIMLHATTTSGWGFGAGRHIPRLEDCTLCRMPRPAAEFRGPCAEGEIVNVNGKEIRASLPFLSTASAALLVASYLQLQCGIESVQLPNAVSADLGFGLPSVVAVTRGPTRECRGCRAANASMWTQRGGRGRFATYSRPGDAESE
jgi:hypothetical protein